MTESTLAGTGACAGRRVLDVASGFGQDAAALAGAGARVVGVEPSARMSALAQMRAGQAPGPQPLWVRGWADALPFADACFDAAICKGAIDHFDRPRLAIREMARVTRPGGRVVLAIANFESASCRVARGADALRERVFGRVPRRGRRHYDVPHDHFTRYELPLVREQAGEWLELDGVLGISLAWGLPGWSRSVERMPAWLARASLQALDWLARRLPSLADVVVVSGRPRRAAMASA
jgi:SAM-dependent methyltransferase